MNVNVFQTVVVEEVVDGVGTEIAALGQLRLSRMTASWSSAVSVLREAQPV